MRACLILLLLRLRIKVPYQARIFLSTLINVWISTIHPWKWRVIMWKGWEEKGKGSKSKSKCFSYLVVTWVENKGYKIVSYDSKYYIHMYSNNYYIFFLSSDGIFSFISRCCLFVVVLLHFFCWMLN